MQRKYLLDNNHVYQQFASIYDRFMTHVPYGKWVDFTKKIIQKYEHNPITILDLGCGTGEIAIRLAASGYRLTGVDIATDMLSCASGKAQANKVDITWINQDIRELTGFTDIDLCISYLDVMNYIVKPCDVKKVFAHVYQSLAASGMFIFDVHHLHYVNTGMIDHTFADVTDDLAYVWDCVGTETEGEMYHYLTFFQQRKQHYVRFDEIHHQRALTPATYKTLLKDAGFRKIHFHSDFNSENGIIGKSSERIFIIAEK